MLFRGKITCCEDRESLGPRMAVRVRVRVAQQLLPFRCWGGARRGWHGRELGTPREVRNALVYVLANGAKHGVNGAGAIDLLSSAPCFRGFLELRERPAPDHSDATTVAARTWLLRVGWQKWGLISLGERPKT